MNAQPGVGYAPVFGNLHSSRKHGDEGVAKNAARHQAAFELVQLVDQARHLSALLFLPFPLVDDCECEPAAVRRGLFVLSP